MGRRVFNPESGPWKILGWLGDLLILSMLWVVCSAPLLTAGAASAALYDAVARSLRPGKTDTLPRFFQTLRAALKNALLPTLLCLAVLALLLWLDLRFAAGLSTLLRGAFLAVLLVPTGICCWVFPLLSRFTLDFNSLCRNSVRLALGHVPATLALGLGAMVCLWLVLRFAFLPLFLLPALFALYLSLFLEPVFRQYEHPEE